jgi:hypothetical protein
MAKSQGTDRRAGLNDRLKSAADAKKKVLAKAAARPGADDPAVQARLAERTVAAAARDQRQAKRQADRVAQEEAAAAARAAAKLAREQEAEQKLRDEADLKAAQKAARDQRYAARKARK